MSTTARGGAAGLKLCSLALLLLLCPQAHAFELVGRIVAPGATFDPSTSIVFTQAGRLGWVADSGRNRLFGFDAVTGRIIATAEFSSPGSLSALPNDQRVAVPSLDSNTLAIALFDPSSVRRIESLQPVALAPFNNIVFSSDGSRGFIADHGFDNLIAFSPVFGGMIGAVSLGVGSDPGRIAISSDGLIAALHTGASARAISIIDSRSLLVSRISLPNAQFAPFNNIVFAPSGNQELGFASSFGSNEVIVFNPRTRDTAAIPVGRGPTALTLSPDGRNLAVVNGLSGSVSFIDPVLLRIRRTVTLPIFQLDAWNNVAFSANGRIAYIGSAFTDEVLALEVDSGRILTRIAVGRRPEQVAANFAAQLLFAVNSGEGTVSALAFALRFPLIRHAPGSEFTGLALANPEPSAQLVNLTGFSNSGALLSDQRIVNPLLIELRSGRQIARLADELFSLPFAVEGWARATSLDGTVHGFMVIGDLGTSLSGRLDGAAASGLADSNLLFSRSLQVRRLGASARAELHIVNCGFEPNAVRLALLNEQGREQTARSLILRPLEKISGTVSSIFDVTNPPGAGRIEVRGSQPMVGLEVISTDEALFMLPAQPARGANRLYSAHLASGRAGGEQFFTELSLINIGSEAATFEAVMLADDGSIAARSPAAQLAAGEQITVTLDQLFAFPPASVDSQLRSGSLVVRASRPSLIGDLLFGDARAGSFLSALHLAAAPARRIIFSHIAEGEVSGLSFFTGIALFAPTAAAGVELSAFASDGALIGRSSFSLPSGGRSSRILREFVAGAVGKVGGLVEVAVSGEGAVGLELFGTVTPIGFLAAVPP